MYNAEIMKKLEERIAKIYKDGCRETFEAGMESEFSLAIERIIHEEGVKVLIILMTYVNNPDINFEVFSEGLIWIGCTDEEDKLGIKIYRKIFLEYCLLSSISSRVKDAAGLGLASINNPTSIPILKMAINREAETISGPSLKVLLQQVLDQLIETKNTQGGNNGQ